MTENELAAALFLPNEIALAYAAIPQLQQPLFPEEKAAVKDAVPKRQREFRAGRTAARQAFARLGLPGQGIPRASNRSPCWPLGIVGSISHSDHTAVAVAARQENVLSLGVDIEPLGGVGEDLWRLLFTAPEQAVLRKSPAWVAVLFFAVKEAFYKLQHPLTGQFLSFLDVEVALEKESRCTLCVNESLVHDSIPTASVKISYAHCAAEIVAFCRLPVGSALTEK